MWVWEAIHMQLQRVQSLFCVYIYYLRTVLVQNCVCQTHKDGEKEESFGNTDANRLVKFEFQFEKGRRKENWKSKSLAEIHTDTHPEKNNEKWMLPTLLGLWTQYRCAWRMPTERWRWPMTLEVWHIVSLNLQVARLNLCKLWRTPMNYIFSTADPPSIIDLQFAHRCNDQSNWD